ncbi:RNA polymerase sporulation sigma factor SigH [Petrocella atlantisensis]|nr:RNA polymerase sporulation sigma factor SigH [Petrocella atlantisensis]MCF8019945.1 RNA polymerase sporulation sigma factor SigH [Vallitaleaceae bacterium]
MERVIAFEELTIYTDEEIVVLIREGHDYALDYLMNKYKKLVEKKSKSYFLMGAGRDDLIQEGMIGLFKAVRDYRNDTASSFFSFADLCITRQIITAVKAATRQKHMPLNSYVSLNKPIFEEDNDKIVLMDLMPSKQIVDPEELIIDKENIHIIEDELADKLSDFEKDVLEYYVEGIGYVEIAEILEKPVKSIDNALQRIKKKLEIIMKEKK